VAFLGQGDAERGDDGRLFAGVDCAVSSHVLLVDLELDAAIGGCRKPCPEIARQSIASAAIRVVAPNDPGGRKLRERALPSRA